ncbi:hypothetical protein QBE53_06200 [Vallitaleaceae bacterium 9-2]
MESIKNFKQRSLQLLLNQHGKAITGTKQELSEKILELVEAGAIKSDTFNEWIENQNIQGNKHLYIYSINKEIVDTIEEKKLSLKVKEMRESDRMFDPTSVEVTETHALITVKESRYRRRETETEEKYEEIDFFVLIDIDKRLSVANISFDPPTEIYTSNKDGHNITTANLRDRYKKIVETLFECDLSNEYLLNSKVLKYMWNLVNDSINTNLTPYTDKISDQIDLFANMMNTVLDLELDSTIIENICRDLKFYTQGVIITYSNDEFTFENQYGKIITESFSGKSGQSVVFGNETGVENTPVHYSLKGPVSDDSNYQCKHLKFAWDTSHISGMKRSEVITIIDSSRNYFRVKFVTYATREEMGYVLSKIAEIKGRIQDSERHYSES